MTGSPAPLALDTAAFRLVAAACAAAAAGRDALPPAPGDVDPQVVQVLVERHRLSAPVCRLLAVALGERASLGLTQGTRRQRMLALEQTRRTVSLSRLLAARGIAHLVVKGAALSEQLYGDVAARASKDIDLLVAPARLAEAGEAIAAAGFARTDAEEAARKHRTYAAGAIQVELHDRLVDLPSYVPLDFDALWARRTTVALLGDEVPVTGEVDTLLYLCAHGAEHVWFRLKWLQDIARLVATDPGGRIAASYDAACAAGFDRVFVAMLRLADDVLGAHAELLDCLPASAADDRAVARAVALARDALAAPAELAHVPTTGWVVRRSLMQLGMRRDWRYRRDLLADMAVGARSFDPARRGALALVHLPVRAVRFWRTRG